jgi:hypothetical protein
MQRLDLNLASNPFRNNTLLWVGYGTATLLLVVFSVWNVNTFVDYRSRLLALRDTVGTFQTQRLELETRGKRALNGIRRFDVESLELRTDKANEVIEWKAFSWTRLFNVLERVLPNQVRMNSVRPIFSPTARGQDQGEIQAGAMPVAIEGTARSFDDLAELQRAFHADAQIGRVEPRRLDKTDKGEFAFQLRFMYVPSEDEPKAGDSSTPDAEAGDGSGLVASDEVAPEVDEPSEDVPPESSNDDAAAAGEQDVNAMVDPVEVTEPGPPGEIVEDVKEGETADGPASKAKRAGGARQRSDPRRRRPASREDGEDRP